MPSGRIRRAIPLDITAQRAHLNSATWDRIPGKGLAFRPQTPDFYSQGCNL
jgi:hypothetical protein